MRIALEHCRADKGPYALELMNHRFLGHFVGDPQAYRLPHELESARGKDAIPAFRKRVTEAGLLDAADLDAIEAEVEAEVEDATVAALAAAAPDPKRALTRDVYKAYA